MPLSGRVQVQDLAQNRRAVPDHNLSVARLPAMRLGGVQRPPPPGVPGKLGRIARQDGTSQATYNGRPLYRYGKDTKPGDVNGQNVGGTWFVVPTTSTAACRRAGGRRHTTCR